MASEIARIEIQYLPKDWRPHVYTSRRKTILWVAVFSFLVLFALYTISSRFIREEIEEPLRLILIIFLFGVPFLTIVVNILLSERVTRARASKWGGRLTVIIDETGITYTEKHKMARFEWEAYKSAVELSDKFVLASDHGGLLIPKRSFDSQESLQSFRERLTRALPVQSKSNGIVLFKSS
jgi:hypothetical protein